MSVNHELLREGIIQKLKDINAYIDNELPDYIMVMLANKKTVHQINNDLQLFLGDNTNLFTTWLQDAISNSGALLASESKRDRTPGLEEDASPEPGSGGQEEEEGKDITPPPPPKAVAGTKRKRSEGSSHPQDYAHHRTSVEREGEEPSPPKASKVAKAGSGEESGRVQRVKLGEQPDEGERSRRSVRKPVIMKPQSSRDTDLRELIAERRALHRHQGGSGGGRGGGGGGGGGDSGEEEEGPGEGRSAAVSSVVRIVERPQLSGAGGSRLLQRAIRGLGGRGQLPKGGARQQEGVARQSGSSSKSAGGWSSRARKQPKPTTTTTASEEVPSSTSSLPTPPHLPTPSDQDSDLPDDKVEESFVDEFREEQQEEEERRELMEQATIAAVKKVLPREGVGQRVGQEAEQRVGQEEGQKVKQPDLRELLNKSKGKGSSQSASRSTRFVVTLDGLGDRYQYVDTSEDLEKEGRGEAEKKGGGAKEEEEQAAVEEEEEEEEEDAPSRGGGMPERCRFWPNCKNGDSCPFHHPSAACRLFPNCKYGNKCLFIHPQCKFDSRCTRADCPYMHTAPRHLAFKPQIPVAPPVVFPPKFRPSTSQYSYSPRAGGGGVGGGMSPWTRPSRFPNKSALTWTPSKSQHISDRQFAAPEDQTAAFPI